MDNLTHSLVGVMMARAGLSRGVKGTTLMLLLAANAPDVDTYSFFTNTLNYLEVHRGYTHALALAPLIAVLPVAIVRGYQRMRPTFYDWFVCLLAVLSHLLLDWTNVYGVRMLLPFSDRWLHLDITNVIDPVIWLILLAALAFPALVRLITSEIGGRVPGPARGWAYFALFTLLAYEGVRLTAHDRVVGQLDARLYMGEPASAVYAFPETLGFLRWRGVVYGDGFVYEAPVDLTTRFDLSDGTFDYQPHDAPALDAAKMTHVFQVFEAFDQAPCWRLNPLVDQVRVELFDLRFGSLRRPAFIATALVEPDGRVVDANFSFGR